METKHHASAFEMNRSSTSQKNLTAVSKACGYNAVSMGHGYESRGRRADVAMSLLVATPRIVCSRYLNILAQCAKNNATILSSRSREESHASVSKMYRQASISVPATGRL